MSTLITVTGLKDAIASGQSLQLIDVRTASEYAGGHIPCAINIPMDQFEARRKDLRPAADIVLICKAGSRAQMVAGWMGSNSAVRVLQGGTEAWKQNGLELVTSARTRWSLERQVRLGAGLLALGGSLLTIAGVSGAIWLVAFVGAGLTFAGLTDLCMMGMLLAKMPWNQARKENCGKAAGACCG
jgi:rhodanese-related sulfurtransferase